MKETNKNDLMMIQNDLLGDIKNVDIKLNERIKILNQSLEEQRIGFEKKISALEKVYNSLLQQIQPTKSIDDSKEKEIISQINVINKTLEENSTRLEIKINDLQENLKESTYKYDRAIADNFVIPGLVGPKAPFKSLRELIEITYKKSNESLKLKEKQGIDLKKYKEKMENIISMNKSELKTMEDKLNKTFQSQIKDLEKKFNERINITEERINTLRVENGKYTFDLLAQGKEIKNDCEQMNKELRISLDEHNKEFFDYINIFKETEEKLTDFEEKYNTFKSDLNSINENLENINKSNSNLENKIKEVEKSILTNKKSIHDYLEKNDNTEISKSNNNTGFLEEDEKNSFLSNRMKKLDIKKIQNDRKNLISKSYLKSNGFQISEDNEENTKINSVLYDAEFFGDSKLLGNSFNYEYLNDTDKIKRAKMTHARIRSGKLLNHFPYISHDVISNNEETVNKINKEKKEILKLSADYIKQKKILKEINFPYNNHKYKYLEKKIDILAKSMVNSFNKIISQINYLKKNKNLPDKEQTNPLNSKEKEETFDIDNTTVIHSIKNINNFKSPLIDKKYSVSDIRNPDFNASFKKVNKIRSKFNEKIKVLKSRESKIKNK